MQQRILQAPNQTRSYTILDLAEYQLFIYRGRLFYIVELPDSTSFNIDFDTVKCRCIAHRIKRSSLWYGLSNPYIVGLNAEIQVQCFEYDPLNRQIF